MHVKLKKRLRQYLKMKKLNKAETGYDKLHHQKGFGEEMELYETLAGLLKGKKAVDIGCGSGLIEKFSPETVGVDFSSEALKVARKNGAKNLVKAEAENLPFSDNEFEISLCNGVLEHCFDQEKAISEMARVSKIQIIIAHAKLPYGLECIRKPIVERILRLKDQPIEKPLSMGQIERMLNNFGSRVMISGVWNYIDPRWLWKRLPYGFIKWPSHHFVISVKTQNLQRKFLGEGL